MVPRWYDKMTLAEASVCQIRILLLESRNFEATWTVITISTAAISVETIPAMA